MKYRVIRDCMIGTGKARAGDIVELSEEIGRSLVFMGRVVPEGAITNNMVEDQPMADRQVKTVARRNARKTAPKNQSR
jgi:hypothetical protein